MRELWEAIKDQRRRIASMVAIVGILMVGSHFAKVVPTDVELMYRLGPDHEQLRELSVSFVKGGEEVKGVRFSRPAGFGPDLSHTVELSPGRYDVIATLRGEAHTHDVTRALTVPAEGVVRLELFDQALAIVHEGSL